MIRKMRTNMFVPNLLFYFSNPFVGKLILVMLYTHHVCVYITRKFIYLFPYYTYKLQFTTL